ncbi:MAG: transferase, partial [Conexibacter sp.]|nr:transferase [Conexibacter sp.]
MSGPARYDVVIPTSGRPSLDVLLAALGAADGPLPERVLLVDDRREGSEPLAPRVPGALLGRTFLVRGGGRGPAARNLGWRAGTAPWVAFLDDDVIPPPGWRAELASDLAGLTPTVAGSQGRVRVPMARGMRATDWQRNASGREHARWASADLAFRRAALEAVGGFHERLPRAGRENAELGLRLAARGLGIVPGRRRVLHPVTPADRSVSMRTQAGDVDDLLMRALHGRAWRALVRAPPGRLPACAATT